MTNTFKKTALTLTALQFPALLLTSNAWAASQTPSSLIGRRGDAKETSLERDIDGLTITCEGVSFINKAIWVSYSVLSEEDSVVGIGELTDIFDDKGRVIKVPIFKIWCAVLIGGNPGDQREIIGGVSTAIAVGYYLGKSEYELAKTYARVSLNINGQNIVFRNAPGKPSAEFDVDAYGEKMTFKDLPSEPFFEFNGHIYKVFPEAVDWRTAKRKCEEERGHLCTITSKEEYDGIISNLPQGERGHHYWIGATDEKQEGHWEWVTGEKFDFSMWSPGQPDNHSTIEHYLELWFEPDRWGWNDAKPHKFYYICEWE